MRYKTGEAISVYMGTYYDEPVIEHGRITKGYTGDIKHGHLYEIFIPRSNSHHVVPYRDVIEFDLFKMIYDRLDSPDKPTINEMTEQYGN